jgi:hypothetical protein
VCERLDHWTMGPEDVVVDGEIGHSLGHILSRERVSVSE